MIDLIQFWSLIKIPNTLNPRAQLGTPHPTDSKIYSFENYAGLTVADTVQAALFWRERLSLAGFSSVEAFPGDEGEILISGIERNLEFEVIVESGGLFSVTFSVDDVVQRELSYGKSSEVDSILKEAAIWLWTSSGGLRLTSSIPAKIASPASPFENRVTMALCPS